MAKSAIQIAIDLTALLPQHSGVDRYIVQLVRHLGVVDRKNSYTVFLNAADQSLLRDILPGNFRLRPWCFRPRPARLLFQQVVLPAACNAMGVAVLHSPSFLMPYWRGRARHLLTVHERCAPWPRAFARARSMAEKPSNPQPRYSLINGELNSRDVP